MLGAKKPVELADPYEVCFSFDKVELVLLATFDFFL